MATLNTPGKAEKLDVAKEKYIYFIHLGNAEQRRANGMPETKTEFAKLFGVSRQTLNNWDKDPEFKRQAADPVLNYFSTDDLVMIMAGLKKKAFDGNVQAAKLIFQMSGILNEDAMQSTQVEKQLEKVQELTDEQLAKLIEEQEKHD